MPHPIRVILTVLLLAASGLRANGLDVPFVRQTGAGCGWAAVAMVMQYWIRETPSLHTLSADTERISEELRPTSRGLTGKQLRAYLEGRGFDVYTFSGTMDDLTRHLDKGRPVIVCLKVRGLGTSLHYAVVAGIEGPDVVLNDPARGQRYRKSREDFLREWSGTKAWALLAVPSVPQ